jgi:beta-galactosidase
MKKLCVLWGLLFPLFLLAQNDPFLQKKYARLHDSPLQQKFRRLAPIPVGAVFIQQAGEGEAEIRQHFRNMKKLGFNCLKQILTIPGWTIEQVQLLALEEGLVPWWYGEGGWEDINEALLQKLGISLNTPLPQVRNDPKMLAYQTNILRERVLAAQAYRVKNGKPLQDRSVAFEPEVGGRGFDLSEKGQALFVEWLKNKYGSIEKINQTWNQAHAGMQPGEQDPFQSWEDLAARHSKMGGREYRRLHDILLFKVEHSLENIRKTCENYRSVAPGGVFRGGGEIGLFHPLAWYGVDLERIADLMQEFGSFYPSVHYAWHFGEAENELVRPFYMQSSLANDFFKGGWAATWESSGGPQQLSGGRGGAYFTVDAGTQTQFLLSQLAAGFKGWGTWTWSTRAAGIEAGEYGLLDRNGQISERAIRTGLIGQTANRYREELWQAQKEPLVGVLYDWSNEAFWAAMSEAGRPEFKYGGVEARVGVSRALINANVPFEYVTSTDLRQGLAGRYKVIYLPAILSLYLDLLPILQKFVEDGGRLVMDAPTGYFDEQGALLKTIKGSVFERLFGLEIRDYQGAGTNRDYFLNGQKMAGFILDLNLTTALSLARFNDGKVAVTENKVGKGSAVVLGYEASKTCFKPSDKLAESQLLRYTLGNLTKPYTCTGAIAYRLSSPQADHYFLINDGPATQAALQFGTYPYRSISDAMSGQALRAGQPIALEAHSGRWIRCEKNVTR